MGVLSGLPGELIVWNGAVASKSSQTWKDQILNVPNYSSII